MSKETVVTRGIKRSGKTFFYNNITKLYSDKKLIVDDVTTTIRIESVKRSFFYIREESVDGNE